MIMRKQDTILHHLIRFAITVTLFLLHVGKPVHCFLTYNSLSGSIASINTARQRVEGLRIPLSSVIALQRQRKRNNVQRYFNSLEDELDSEELEQDLPSIEPIILSEAQIKELRKEISKRKARKDLPFISLSPEDCLSPDPQFSDESILEIAQQLNSHELVEVRGISRNEKKYIFSTSESLATELAYELGRDVVVVARKGFSATYYCPFEQESKNPRKKIILRTSIGKKNVWVKREKPKRDIRGQIIRDDVDEDD